MRTIQRVLALLSPVERKQAYMLVPVTVLMAGAEVGGIASIVPFLKLLAEPEMVTSHGLLATLARAAGLDSYRSFVVGAGVVVLLAMLGSNAVLSFGYWALYRFGAMRNHSISYRLLQQYVAQPYSFFLSENSAALANNILQEVHLVINGTVIPGLFAIAKSAAVLAILTFLIVVDPLLALWVGALLGGAYAMIFALTRRHLTRIGRKRVVANQTRHQAANEVFGGIKELRILGLEQAMTKRYAAPSLDFAHFEARVKIIGSVPRFALEAIAFGAVIAVVVILLASGRAVGEVVATLGLYALAGYRLLPALQQVFWGLTQVRYSSGAVDEVYRMATAATDLRAKHRVIDERPVPLAFSHALRVEGLVYHYDSTRPAVIDGIDLTIPAGSRVALVGASGAGKSTLIDLLLGVLEPQSGRVEVDGVRLDARTAQAWWRNIGYVPQTIYLIDDTVANNIAFGAPPGDVDMDAVREAARLARIADFVERELESGYETVVGERGIRLSGGQRQRLGLARALYRDPQVLVLDEATSALDGATERAVLEALANLPGQRTTIMIAHRLSTVRGCDRIFLLRDGKLAAQGTYDSLAATSSWFRAMLDNRDKATTTSETNGDCVARRSRGEVAAFLSRDDAGRTESEIVESGSHGLATMGASERNQ